MDMRAIAEDSSISIQQKVQAAIDTLQPLLPDQLNNTQHIIHFIPQVFQAFGESSKVSIAIVDRFIDVADSFYNEVLQPVCEANLELLRESKSSSFYAKQIYRFGFMLAEIHQADDNLHLACKVLASIDLDKPQITPKDQVELCVTCAEFYLALDDAISSNKFISKVHRVVKQVDDIAVIFRYKTSYARILDAQRRFLESSRRYFELSQLLHGDEERMISLENAVTCAILAKAGLPRSRILATLYRDERSASLKNYRMLQIMFFDQIVDAKEESAFEKMLRPTQNVSIGNGMTVLKQAIFEHNLLATSKIYDNITFEEMGLILGTSPERAEYMGAKMIEEGRMNATIDQPRQVIIFKRADSSLLRLWDTEIQDMCSELNSVLENVSSAYPEYTLN